MPQYHTVAEMTLHDLEAFVEEIIQREVTELSQRKFAQQTARSLEEIFEPIDSNMIVLPPGAKSSLEFLHEDRER